MEEKVKLDHACIEGKMSTSQEAEKRAYTWMNNPTLYAASVGILTPMEKHNCISRLRRKKGLAAETVCPKRF